jgi:hypothetical protein
MESKKNKYSITEKKNTRNPRTKKEQEALDKALETAMGLIVDIKKDGQ